VKLVRHLLELESLSTTWKPIDQLTLSAQYPTYANGWNFGREGGLLFYSTPYTTAKLAANYSGDDQVSVFGGSTTFSMSIIRTRSDSSAGASAFMAECVSPFSRGGIAVDGI
jgi:hypothetical protein